MKQERARIVRVLSPRVPGSSARALISSELFDQEWSLLNYNVKNICYHDCSTGLGYDFHLRTFYFSPKGITWMLSLPFKLISCKPDLFVCGLATPEHYVTFIIGKLLRKPTLVLDSHWFWPNTLYAKTLWPVSKRIANSCNALALVGRRAKAFWVKAGVKGLRICLYNYYYSNLITDKKAIEESKKIQENFKHKKIILFLGRLVALKGVDNLIKAFKISLESQDNSVLLIVGDGPEKSSLQNLVRSLDLKNVFFVNGKYGDDKIPYFLASALFVYPSKNSSSVPEEWGLAINEAMSVGKPIIVTRSVGCAFDLVENGGNGFIVNSRDIEALAFALKTIMCDEALRTKMGDRSTEIIKNYTLMQSKERLEQIISKVV
ncbi:MAG: glycosyltransferase family 4 protein [Candidatus Bathyarchaeia archaeon]